MPEKMTMKDKVLGIIARRGAAGPTPLMQGSKATADALKVIVRELEQEGKIKSWPYRGRSGMTAIFTMPDAKDPRTKEMLEAKPAPPAKCQRNIKQRQTDVPPAPSNRSGPFAAAIADLESRRTAALNDVKKYDTAIETLRALA